MEQETHPLLAHLRASDETVSSFADRVGISRNHLYRVMRGENATTSVLVKISDATGGAVPVQEFFPAPQPQEASNG